MIARNEIKSLENLISMYALYFNQSLTSHNRKTFPFIKPFIKSFSTKPKERNNGDLQWEILSGFDKDHGKVHVFIRYQAVHQYNTKCIFSCTKCAIMHRMFVVRFVFFVAFHFIDYVYKYIVIYIEHYRRKLYPI